MMNSAMVYNHSYIFGGALYWEVESCPCNILLKPVSSLSMFSESHTSGFPARQS